MTRLNEYGQPVGRSLGGWRPPPYPAAVPLTGRWCRLEPLSVERHGADLFAALHDDDGRQWTYLSAGPFADLVAFRAYLAEAEADLGKITYAIIDQGTGRADGMASYLRIEPASGSIEVGSIIYGPRLRRAPGATEAMYLMATQVFDDLGYRRYEWKCDSLNAKSRAAAVRLGFRYEGTWRNAIVYKGRNRDTAWYAMTDDDWPAVRQVLRDWLDPANFADGQQRTSLSELMRTRPDTPAD